MASERKLATVRRITSIKPIPGADAIECAVVDGWQVVVKKGEFQPGDSVIYFEIDSVLPVLPEFEFLRKSCYVKREWLPNGEGFRLRTIKLRGQISQGLVVPISSTNIVVSEPGADLSDALGVVKWDPPVPAQLAGQAEGNFPSFIRKTDEERCQNIVSEIKESFDSGELFEITTKLDGTSFTAFYKDGETGICSRNFQLKDNEENKNNSYIKIARDTGLIAALTKLGMNVAIQGELMGPGIQGNRESLSTTQLFVFNVFDIDNQVDMDLTKRLMILDRLRELGFSGEHVPVLYYGVTLPSDSISELLMFTEGPSLRNSVREGVVFKSRSRDFSFKAISNTFLLQEK